MLDVTNLKTMKKAMLDYAEQRRELIKTSGDALHLSKRAIFAMHRDDLKEAKEKIAGGEILLKQLHKKFNKTHGMLDEGAYREAMEEHVEAVLLYEFLTKKKISKIKSIPVSAEVYIAGLCDVAGELYRYAIKAATARDMQTTIMCKRMAEEIVGELIEFNLTRYLRTKFDQAKQSVRKIEQVVYDLSLRME